MSAGWVYVCNTAEPGLVKVGMTSRAPTERAKELAHDAAYRRFAPFTVAWSRPIFDCAAVESATHRMLGDKRARHLPREMFRTTAEEASRVANAAAEAAYIQNRPQHRRRAPPQETRRQRRWPGPRRRLPSLTAGHLIALGLAAAALVMLS